MSILLLLFFAPFVVAWVSVVPSLAHVPAGVRAACQTTLAKNITQCSDSFQLLADYIEPSSLEEICTQVCADALSSLYTEAVSRCGTDSVDVIVDRKVVAVFTPLDLVEQLIYRHRITCLQDKHGFCMERLDDVPDDEICSECYLNSIQLQLNLPVPEGPYNPDSFNSLKESCNIPTTSYPVTPGPTTTPPTATPTCSNTYIVQGGDTINSIAQSLSIATDWLLIFTGYPMDSSVVPEEGDRLCLDNVFECLLHQVTEGDTCASLLTIAGPFVDTIMFESWNPTMGRDCLNLHAMVGKYICIGPPGAEGKYTPIIPSPTVTTTSAPTVTYSYEPAPDTLTNPVNLPTQWIFPEVPEDIIAVNTFTDFPDAGLKDAIEVRTEFCPFTNEDNSTLWNEGLAEDELRLHSWDLDEECQDEWDFYCFPDVNADILPSPTHIASSCYPTVITIIPEGWVDPPGPTSSGVPDTCNKWHMVNNGDACAEIASQFDLSLADFHALNPSINPSCGNLRAGFAVCVRMWVEEEPERTTTTSTTTTTAVPPGPTATGTSPTCTKWHLHVQGDTCASIAEDYGIIVSRFCQLNRSVDSGCTNLILGNAYCVG
ncbi:hypothetical protein BDV12DRAFT_181000 [Aspergillus spectabilis]